MADIQQPHVRGSIREMAAIALPMVVSMSCDTLMIFTDRLFLSRLGPEQMNAAMGGGLTAFMMMSFFIGLTGYATALVAQCLGAGQKNRCAVVLTQAAILSGLAAAFQPFIVQRPVQPSAPKYRGGAIFNTGLTFTDRERVRLHWTA